jgi:hypothetical protein
MVEGKLLIIILYVYDLILTGDDQLVLSCEEDLAKEFKMKDMGLLHYFLGLEIWQQDGEIFVSQGKYAREILLGMCYILCMCVCGRIRFTTASDDPSSSVLCVMCTEHFPRGVPGGAGMPPLVTCSV